MDRFSNPTSQMNVGGPFRGGAVTVRERPLVEHGGFSMIQNLRAFHPGFKQRLGSTLLHDTPIGLGSVYNVYQHNKTFTGVESGTGLNETRFFAQLESGFLYQFSGYIPDPNVGSFGTNVYFPSFMSLAANLLPASFSNLKNLLIYSDGGGQHQVNAGQQQKVGTFRYLYEAGGISRFPEEGWDYTLEVSDGDLTSSAVLNVTMQSTADKYGIFIRTQTPADWFDFTMTVPNLSASSLMQVDYWDGTDWSTLAGVTDTTHNGNGTLAQNGRVELTLSPSDERPHYMFGESGYWYRLYVSSGQVDINTSILLATYGSGFHSIENVWNGVPIDVVEVDIYDDSVGTYQTYAASNIILSSLTANDDIYFCTQDKAIGLYVNIGSTPNTAATTINNIYYWDGDSWVAVSSLVDGSSGFSESGWVTWEETSGEFRRQFNSFNVDAYWYKIELATATISTNVIAGLTYMPVFDIDDFGSVGRVSAVWKNRAIYTFSKFPRDLYVAQIGEPLYLNGSDYTILNPGDGRDNATVAMCLFYNELMVFQEEKGRDGGCITLFEGYNPATFGKLIISTKIGTFSQKSVCVVDGSTIPVKTTQRVQTMVYLISHYGVFQCDGQLVTMISQDIQNYFDPEFDECIRKGYEDYMWIEHDTSRSVLKLGLVSGATAEEPNVFPVFDLVDGVWSFDTHPVDALTCMHEVEADPNATDSNKHVRQVAGSINGFAYLLNDGVDDVNTAVDALFRMELSAQGYQLQLTEIIARLKAQSSGNFTIKIYEEGNPTAVDTRTISMTAEEATQIVRRVRELFDNDQYTLLTIEFRNNNAGESIYLEDMIVEVDAVARRG